jgi:hypothetical protein
MGMPGPQLEETTRKNPLLNNECRILKEQVEKLTTEYHHTDQVFVTNGELILTNSELEVTEVENHIDWQITGRYSPVSSQQPGTVSQLD